MSFTSTKDTTPTASDSIYVKPEDAGLKWYCIANIVFLLFILLGSSINGLVLWNIQRYKPMRTPFNHLVSAMLVANLLRSLTTPVMDMLEIYHNFQIQTMVYCELKLFLVHFNYNVSLITSTAIALLRAYVCIKQSVTRLELKTVVSVLAGVCMLSGFLTVGNILPGSTTLNICLAILPILSNHITRYWSVAKGLFTVFLFILVLVSYVLIAIFVRVKNRDVKMGHKDVFTLRAGVVSSCVFAFTFVCPYIGGFMIFGPAQNDYILIMNIVCFFKNLTYLDVVLMPLMIVHQNKRLTTQIKSFLCRSSNVSNSVAPTGTAMSCV